MLGARCGVTAAPAAEVFGVAPELVGLESVSDHRGLDRSRPSRTGRLEGMRSHGRARRFSTLAPAIAVASLVLVGATCGGEPEGAEDDASSPEQEAVETTERTAAGGPNDEARSEPASAIFAGGCFWCMEPPFDKLEGVLSTISGYTGGKEKNPTYKQVSSGRTGHTEAVEVTYDPAKISYVELLGVFWRNIDPTVQDRQFCDWGSQYRTGIFYLGGEQQRLAESSRQEIIDSKRFESVYTEVTAASEFYPAEEYHQDFYKKNPAHYQRYRTGCGRDRRLQELWGDGGQVSR